MKIEKFKKIISIINSIAEKKNNITELESLLAGLEPDENINSIYPVTFVRYKKS